MNVNWRLLGFCLAIIAVMLLLPWVITLGLKYIVWVFETMGLLK